MVSCTCAVEACSASPIAGSDGRYMSIDSGPSPVKSDSSKVSAKVPGRSIGTNQYPGLHKAQSGVKRAAVADGAAGRERSGLGPEELAPALRGDVAVDDLAGIRRLPLDAAVALLIVVRMILIFGVGLADLLLRRGPRRRGA